EVELAVLAVPVQHQRELRVQAELEQVLPVQIGDEDVILARRFAEVVQAAVGVLLQDRKSTRLNSSHVKISYAVFCLKKKMLCLAISGPLNLSRKTMNSKETQMSIDEKANPLTNKEITMDPTWIYNILVKSLNQPEII